MLIKNSSTKISPHLIPPLSIQRWKKMLLKIVTTIFFFVKCNKSRTFDVRSAKVLYKNWQKNLLGAVIEWDTIHTTKTGFSPTLFQQLFDFCKSENYKDRDRENDSNQHKDWESGGNWVRIFFPSFLLLLFSILWSFSHVFFPCFKNNCIFSSANRKKFPCTMVSLSMEGVTKLLQLFNIFLDILKDNFYTRW